MNEDQFETTIDLLDLLHMDNISNVDIDEGNHTINFSYKPLYEINFIHINIPIEKSNK